MFTAAQKCKNIAIFKQNFGQNLFIAFNTVKSCCFSLGRNLDLLCFKQKRLWLLFGQLSKKFWLHFIRKSGPSPIKIFSA